MFTDYEGYDLKEWTSGCIRRPYYRLIGKPVTQEQALEIIARTDRFWTCVAGSELFEKVRDQFVYTYSPMNAYWFYNLFPSQHGFVKPNGNVYSDGITAKWFEVNELSIVFHVCGSFNRYQYCRKVIMDLGMTSLNYLESGNGRLRSSKR